MLNVKKCEALNWSRFANQIEWAAFIVAKTYVHRLRHFASQ